MKHEHNTLPHTTATTCSPSKKIGSKGSTWVVVGFLFWIGFFIGAVILHAMVK